jgi:hypothetical protein
MASASCLIYRTNERERGREGGREGGERERESVFCCFIFSCLCFEVFFLTSDVNIGRYFHVWIFPLFLKRQSEHSPTFPSLLLGWQPMKSPLSSYIRNSLLGTLEYSSKPFSSLSPTHSRLSLLSLLSLSRSLGKVRPHAVPRAAEHGAASEQAEGGGGVGGQRRGGARHHRGGWGFLGFLAHAECRYPRHRLPRHPDSCRLELQRQVLLHRTPVPVPLSLSLSFSFSFPPFLFLFFLFLPFSLFVCLP